MLLLTGCHKLPDHKMYPETAPDTITMPRNNFERILRNLHLCDNEQIDKQDEFSKLLPLINESNRIFLKFSFNR